MGKRSHLRAFKQAVSIVNLVFDFSVENFHQFSKLAFILLIENVAHEELESLNQTSSEYYESCLRFLSRKFSPCSLAAFMFTN